MPFKIIRNDITKVKADADELFMDCVQVDWGSATNNYVVKTNEKIRLLTFDTQYLIEY